VQSNTQILGFNLKEITQKKITLNIRKLMLNIGMHKEKHIAIIDTCIKKCLLVQCFMKNLT